ncbi:MAG TPA: response regulator, partial [Nannocystis exedens]|nr:response regulator [Nannocystis exedens]
ENGEQAVAIAAEWAPHLIWMDVRMPVMDGVEATQRIKALPGGEAIVVIAISANVLGGGRERMIAAGCVDFVAKPFRVQVLFDLLSRYLGCTYVEVASPAMRAD